MVSTALKCGQTPYQLWYGKKPSLKHIQAFGCIVYTHISDGECKMLDKKAQKLRFLETANNYKFGMKRNKNVTFVMMLFSTRIILGGFRYI